MYGCRKGTDPLLTKYPDQIAGHSPRNFKLPCHEKKSDKVGGMAAKYLVRYLYQIETSSEEVIMSFGQNLQFLRKMGNEMTQEQLAEKLCVSRQTISKWELDTAYPEMNKLLELCDLFSCSMDELVRGDMNVISDAYSEIRFETVEPFSCIRYAAISTEPEDDAIHHVRSWAKELDISDPEVIGWDFPFLSQEQINVWNMHGYEAALILRDEKIQEWKDKMEKSERVGSQSAFFSQEEQRYIVITIKDWSDSPFRTIPNAYKILMTHMRINGIGHKQDKTIIPCFEKDYEIEGRYYMDVYIAIE